ncbi:MULTISPECIES: OmpH family outer membrane protein [unclassified Halomonas]|uniref:OmpH family outer membrane protein n=1 Tax=unclassified Halomonas TaxID=2609666 RepID=UPI000C898AA6|nr:MULTISPECIES: OmpH family outer membrane protein [unclassified Halomonas]MAR74528.1 molecular chaperone Skp [Halomonas sp.]MBR9881498.1 OmpH family outer membrane protein [Gammaproteobacteria bacterium]|tara:strand:+ start:4113 stop:4619 length:507 start_codon:yes stop_codon:yes gene_type:complete
MRAGGRRRWLVWLTLAAALSSPVSASASQVAVLDWRRAVLDTEAARSAMQSLQEQVAPWQHEAETLRLELEALADDLAAAEGQPSPSRVQEFQRKGQRFDRLRRDILEARQEAEQRLISRLEGRVDQAVAQVIERHEVEVLVTPDGVLHSGRDLPDLTAEVTRLLNTY